MSGRRVSFVATALLAAVLVASAASAWSTNTRTETIGAAAPDSATAEPLDGRQVFMMKGCSGCHNAPGVASLTGGAPNLYSLRDVAATRRSGLSAEAYVIESIRTPQAFIVSGYDSLAMPTLSVSDAELTALVAYLLRSDR